MKVDLTKQNYTANWRANYQQNQTAQAAQPQFKGGLSYSERIAESLPHAKTIKAMKSLEWLKGEIGGILITAFGTGLVAPIFIGFNPFVKAPKNATPEQKKENENTKLYTAMRQPISAALAIVFQASVQKYIDKGLDKVFNNPKISKYARTNLDQQELNTKTYIQSKVKKAMKKDGETKPSLINAKVENIQNEQIDNIARKFQETGKINIGERYLGWQSTSKLVNDQIDSYIQDARALQKTPEKIAKYINRAELLTKNEAGIRNVFGQISEQNVTSDVQKLLAKESNPDIKTLLQEILNKPEDLRYSRVQRTLQRIDCIKTMCGGNFTRDKYKNALVERNGILADRIVELTGAKLDTKTADQKAVKEAIEKIAQQCSFKDVEGSIQRSVLCDTDTFGKDLSKITKKVYKDITKGYKKLVENNYKSWNQFTKIGVGVFITLPITCTALNWVYPRFMDIFFPSLSGADEKKPEQAQKIGGNK